MTTIAELRALLAKATPGEWTIRPRAIDEHERIEAGDDAFKVALESTETYLGWELSGPTCTGRGDYIAQDVALIAAMKNALPALLRSAEAFEAIEQEKIRCGFSTHDEEWRVCGPAGWVYDADLATAVLEASAKGGK